MMLKRIMSLLLALVLLVGMVPPVTVSAEEVEETTAETVAEAAEATTSPVETTVPEETEVAAAVEETVAETEPMEVLPELPETESCEDVQQTEPTHVSENDVSDDLNVLEPEALSLSTARGINEQLVYESESNNTREKANRIIPGDTMVGELLTQNSFQDAYPIPDSDYFWFEVYTTAEIEITLLCDYNTLGITLYDSNEDIVELKVPSTLTQSGYHCKITKQLSSGIYYINLFDSDAMYDGYSNGYRLYVESDECQHFEYSATQQVDPTCISEGYTLYTCEECNYSWKANKVDPTGIHIFDDNQENYCNTCGRYFDDHGEGSCGASVNWKLSPGGKLTIYGTGAMDSYLTTATPWEEYSQLVKSIVIEEGVTSIGAKAFYGCINLTAVYISASVSSISASSDYNSPFRNCSSQLVIYCESSSKPGGWGYYWNYYDYSLRATVYWGITQEEGAFWTGDAMKSDVVIPDYFTVIPNEAFKYRTNLKRVFISESVTSIGDNAFRGCTNLTDVTIPNGVISIGNEAFSGCSSLTSIIIPDSVTSVGDAAFSACDNLNNVTLGSGIGCINYAVFSDCSSLTYLRIPDNVTAIGDWAFARCSNLTDVTIPDSVTNIGESVFSECVSLAGVEIPDGIDGINYGMFAGCSKLTDVTIPRSVTRIGNSAFEGCSSLTGITIPDSVTSIGQYVFNDCTSLKNVTIGKGVTSIGDAAFKECTALTQVSIPDSVTAIGAHMFYGCTSLKNVAIGSGVTHIGGAAFSDCSSLKTVHLPEGVTNISSNAFKNCSGLRAVYIPASVTSISGSSESESPFRGCPSSLVLYCGAASKSSDWGQYWSSYDSSNKLTVKWSVMPEEGAFWTGDAQKSEVEIPGYVTVIPDYAFYNRSDLRSVEIPDNVTSIGGAAFFGCDGLRALYIPESVTSIAGDSTFHGCADDLIFYCGAPSKPSNWRPLWNWNGPEKLTAYFGCTRTDYAFWSTLDTSADILVIPEGVTIIPENAFLDCIGLESVYIPNTVSTIHADSFAGSDGELRIYCEADANGSGWNEGWNGSRTVNYGYTHEEFQYWSTLDPGADTIVIPDGITRIPSKAFYGFSELVSVTVPSGVEEIGENAFGHCENLEWILFEGSVPEIDDNAFAGNVAVVYYPAEDPTWTEEVIAGFPEGIELISDCVTDVVILDEAGKTVTGDTIWFDLNSGRESMTFSAFTQPAVADDSVTWHYDHSASFCTVTENQDGTVTVAANGAVGTLMLTAAARDGSGKTGTIHIRFVALSVGKDEIPGEDPADVNLLSGKAKQLSILNADTGKPLTAKEVTWSMDEVYAPYVKLDAKGKLTAKKVVEKVRVEAVASIIGSENTTVTVTIDIFPAVSGVELLDGETMVNNKTISLDSGAEPLVLTANIHPLDAMEGVTWSISDKKEAFATYEIVDNILTVTPKADAKAGNVTIKVTSNDGSKKTATVKLQFAAYAKTVTIDKSITTLTVGDKAVQLSATMTPDVVTKSGIVWSLKNAADKNYVNLSSGGKIAPKAVLAPVDVTIVATSKDGMAKDEHTIRVLPKSQAQLVLMDENGNYVTKTTQTLDVNTQESITLSAFTYGETDMTDVAWSPLTAKGAEITVNEDGSLTIKMLAAGNINVTAKAADGRKATVAIKGVKLAQALEISQKKTNLTEGLEVASGKSVDLQVTLTNAANKKVVWSIEEGGAYATIASSGKFTAAKDLTSSHKVVVRATAADGSGATDTMEIMVRPIAQGVQVYSEAGGRMLFSFRTQDWWVRSNTTLTWDLSTQENTIAMDARVYPYYGEDNARNAIQAVSWKSSTPKVADFVDGQLVIYKTGSTTITAMAEDGSKQKVTVKLNVVRTVTELKIDDQTVASGKSLNLAKFITINPTDATNKKLTWTITKGGEYATLSNNGSFKAKKVTASKRVEVTVSSQDGGASTIFYVTITSA